MKESFTLFIFPTHQPDLSPIEFLLSVLYRLTKTIRRETFDSALSLGQDVLELLGYNHYEAYKLKRLFKKKDEELLPKRHRIHRDKDESVYVSMYQKHNEDLSDLMRLDEETDFVELERAWSKAGLDEEKS